ncbi:membrane associated rhomboid family serine protease [Haloactinopolyspora alba]|uniref:Membrane associated rhomboid family serine protease n=1 Tax=Haloactinopolyspora alba TaxID=648780 RepID=A0A2P8E6Q5_9ACTN|nr:rhomboid family intramembrane serine protease [Haloactinopolyspora alba]PSL05160.1 membrane associated rhomboid family serine protease [Haloactinopolyspora alba]
MTGSAGSPGGPPADGGPAVPTCYRHADRETYVRCSRCERYICPDCMSAAPVGFHCPECVNQGSKSVRQGKTILGGAVRERGDLVTKSLVGITVVMWLLGLVVGNGSLSDELARASRGLINWSEITARLGLVMGSSGDPVSIGLADGEWYRMLTVALVHEEFFHIGMNMFALWILGSALEPVLGRWRFIALYVLSALGGSAASLLTAGLYTVSIGASGAVFGLFGALFIIMRRLGRDTGAVVVILGINVVFGFMVEGIDWRAHLGGLVVGTALAAVFAFVPRRFRTVGAVTACVLMFAIVMTVAVSQVP